MSLEAVAWTKNLEYEVCSHGAFRVLLILAEHASSEGLRAFRSKRKIAATLGVSERSVQRWYKELIEVGLITLGDQRYVSQIPANQRPVVYNLVMHRKPGFRQAEIDAQSDGNLGETELSTSRPGETTAVAAGETAVVVSKNQVLKPSISSIKANHSTPVGMKEAASGDAHQPANAIDSRSSAGTCSNSHPIIGLSGGGVPFCASGCSPIATNERTEVQA